MLGKTSPSPSKTDTELKNLGVSALASLANSFLHSAAIESAELYLGLFAFSFYVLYDTQVIVERAEAGNTDDVRHALTLYTDLADIFIRLLLVMSRNRNTRDRDDENSRRHGNGYGRTRGFRGRGSFL